jgi:hypothetical protein
MSKPRPSASSCPRASQTAVPRDVHAAGGCDGAETKASEDFNKIAYSPDCGGSDNVESGCGGASAFNDDGGVGEGDS